ncbi:hypothetical protein DH2020_000031 [Rehmannia glutinosa]|uniref:DCD domain-containing protein n=1 Tax=Rehmannia glutinosa TaxID=99300 RepID=A0ABR0XVC2_REHGL
MGFSYSDSECQRTQGGWSIQDKVEIPVDKAGNESYEEFSGEEESEKVTKVGNVDENILGTEMNGDNKAESEQNTSEDDEIDDQEDLMWEDEETSEEDNEENVDDKDEVSEEEATKEEDDDEDKVSVEEATEEEDDDEDEVSEEEATEVAKGDGTEGKAKGDGTEGKAKGDGTEGKTKGDGREAKAKEDGRKAKEHNSEKVEVSLKNVKNSSERSSKKNKRVERSKKVDSRDKPESSRKRKAKKKVKSMGMIFMCSSKTKNDCYQYRVLGLPESKKDVVEKIYAGMRLFLYDVDLKLMYGIYRAAGPGGYNIEPKAFKSQFPAQVRECRHLSGTVNYIGVCDVLPTDAWLSRYLSAIIGYRFIDITSIIDNIFRKSPGNAVDICISYHSLDHILYITPSQVKKLCQLFIATSKKDMPKKLGRGRKAEKHRPVRRERSRRQRVGDKRNLPLRDELRPRERPRKRPRKAMTPPPRRPPPARQPSPVRSYVYERTSDVDAYRRDPYLESRDAYRDRRDPPLLIRRDPYRDPPRDPPTERRYHIGDGRDPYLERDYPPYRDGREPYIERRHDPYRDGPDPYSRRRDPYVDERAPYLERRDPYRDGRDSYLERRVPYGDAPLSEPYGAYRRDPLSDRRDVYREDQGVEYRDSFRRDDVLERRELNPFSLETRHGHDIATRDPYVSNRERPSYAEPIYSAEYPSRVGLAREYRL